MPRLLFSFYFTDSFENVIEVLNKGIQELDQEISPKLPKDKKIQHRAEILESFNGIGKNTAALIISQMPKLGSANNRQIAAIAGLAPYNQDGGKRSIRGGRKISRNALYMVALVATRHNLPIKQYYNRAFLTKYIQVD